MSKLQPLDKTVVHLRTQAEYDEYMQLCEEAGWRWKSGDRPKNLNEWKVRQEATCVKVLDCMEYSRRAYYEREKFIILTLPELKAKFGIGTKSKPETWEPHYTRSGYTLHRDSVTLADGTNYTLAELQERAKLLRSLCEAHKRLFPSAK
jgi:hypothetical protein